MTSTPRNRCPEPSLEPHPQSPELVPEPEHPRESKMTPKAYALLAFLAVVLASALCSAATGPGTRRQPPAWSRAQATAEAPYGAPTRPRPRPCSFETLPDGRLLVRCPRG